MTAVVARSVAAMLAQSERPTMLGGGASDDVALDMGEPDFATPEPIVESAVAALRDGHTHYAPQGGLHSFREAIAARQNRRFGTTVGPDQVAVTHGGSGGLTAAILSLVNPGDRVVIPEPTYSLYADLVRMAGGEVVWVSTTDPTWLSSPELARAVSDAKLMILCSPGNPTGSVLTAADWAKVATLVHGAAQLMVLCDEAYADITYGDGFVSSLAAGLPVERVICCGTLSKSFAMTGWRLGYVIAELGLAQHVRAVHARLTGAIATFSQMAGEVAVTSCDRQVDEMKAVFEHRRELVLERLADMDRVRFEAPGGAFYVFPYIDTEATSATMTATLRSHGVRVRSGSEYGPSGEGAIRLSFAAGEQALHEGLERVAKAVATMP